jgi:hypothetical protein
MDLLADAHVHLYESFDLGRLIRTLVTNLSMLAPNAAHGAFLADREGSDTLAAFRDGTLELPDEVGAADLWQNGDVLRVETASGGRLFFFAGRQIVTSERLEILALTQNASIPDGLRAEELIDRVLEAGGVPVVSWAVGKWFGRRGSRVASLLDRYAPGQLLLGDTTMRPNGWPEPGLMRRARELGFMILAGSDPLPIRGDERWAGRYAIRLRAHFDADNPVETVRRCLRARGTEGLLTGRRCGPIEVLARLARYYRSGE